MADTPEDISRDVAAIAQISAVPSLLKVICANTGMGYAAVARVTDGNWTACAVQDDIGFGLAVGGQLDVNTTLCIESRAARAPVVIDHASQDPVYCTHHTPSLYRIESYISVPILRTNGDYFGNLCAIDPRPRVVSDPRTISMFQSFAELIGRQLETEDKQHRTETALLDERATAELREQFIAVLGHDLRNPLASISALGELLARRTAEPEVAKAGERIRVTSRRMARLINDVMDLARSRMGEGLNVALEDVDDLETALGHVILEQREAHPEQEIFEVLKITETVRCDRGRLQQLLSNLLGNAVAHGDAQRPILVGAITLDGWLSLSVQNWGAVIEPEHLQKLFEPYWRPADSAARGGLGLGLHICSQIVKAHGGSLKVVSSAETGTQFTAQIPLRSGTTATA